MNNQTVRYDIMSISAVPSKTFTVNATTDLFTSNAHGLVDGDKLRFTTATTLPAGLSLLTNYYVINATTNTFQVSATVGGTAVNLTDTGTGAHTYKLMGRTIFCADFDTINLTIATNGFTGTYKAQGTDTESAGSFDFGAAISTTNFWDYVELKDLNDEDTILGDDGKSLTTTSEVRQFEVNVSKLRWFTVDVYSYTAGGIGISATLYKK